MTESTAHWEGVYTTKAAQEVSWFQPIPTSSLAALDTFGADPKQSLIDIGGGASTLADTLLDRGWSDVAVLDISKAALAESMRRLGDRASQIDWIVADIARWTPARSYDIWHDRAVFHFLTEVGDREAYKERLIAALAPHGKVVMATFAPDGPERCSDLPVRRYSAESLAVELGSAFRTMHDWSENHITPAGNRQAFTWGVFQRV